MKTRTSPSTAGANADGISGIESDHASLKQVAYSSPPLEDEELDDASPELDDASPLDSDEDEEEDEVGSPLELDVSTSSTVVDPVLSELGSPVLLVPASVGLSLSDDPDDELVDESSGSGSPVSDTELALGSSPEAVLGAGVAPEDPEVSVSNEPCGGSDPHPASSPNTTTQDRAICAWCAQPTESVIFLPSAPP